MRDPVAFSSGQLPTQHFNERFSKENLAYWVPLLIDAAQIEAGQRVLDVGCGTGGFARAIAEAASVAVTGVDSSERFIAFARELPPPAQARSHGRSAMRRRFRSKMLPTNASCYRSCFINSRVRRSRWRRRGS